MSDTDPFGFDPAAASSVAPADAARLLASAAVEDAKTIYRRQPLLMIGLAAVAVGGLVAAIALLSRRRGPHEAT